MTHDDCCELTQPNPAGPCCGCAGRAWDRDPIPATDLPKGDDAAWWFEF